MSTESLSFHPHKVYEACYEDCPEPRYDKYEAEMNAIGLQYSPCEHGRAFVTCRRRKCKKLRKMLVWPSEEDRGVFNS